MSQQAQHSVSFFTPGFTDNTEKKKKKFCGEVAYRKNKCNLNIFFKNVYYILY